MPGTSSRPATEVLSCLWRDSSQRARPLWGHTKLRWSVACGVENQSSPIPISMAPPPPHVLVYSGRIPTRGKQVMFLFVVNRGHFPTDSRERPGFPELSYFLKSVKRWTEEKPLCPTAASSLWGKKNQQGSLARRQNIFLSTTYVTNFSCKIMSWECRKSFLLLNVITTKL